MSTWLGGAPTARHIEQKLGTLREEKKQNKTNKWILKAKINYGKFFAQHKHWKVLIMLSMACLPFWLSIAAAQWDSRKNDNVLTQIFSTHFAISVYFLAKIFTSLSIALRKRSNRLSSRKVHTLNMPIFFAFQWINNHRTEMFFFW